MNARLLAQLEAFAKRAKKTQPRLIIARRKKAHLQLVPVKP